MSRLLGLDLGQRRIGVAVTDSAQTMAVPVGVVDRSGGNAKAIDEIVEQATAYEVERVVLGDPLGLSGEAGEAAAGADRFAEALAERLVPLSIGLDRIDERLTTVTAAARLTEAGVKAREQRARIDAASAVVILEHYLEASS